MLPDQVKQAWLNEIPSPVSPSTVALCRGCGEIGPIHVETAV